MVNVHEYEGFGGRPFGATCLVSPSYPLLQALQEYVHQYGSRPCSGKTTLSKHLISSSAPHGGILVYENYAEVL